ncbi:MAG TPA: GPW/gp25 family protein [Vicinamibacterales bacterium]|nr:GPW/gp25 family protein [Vicinamibacterales bacterium]
MDAGRIYGRGIAFPPHVAADGRMAWSEGETNIREAIEIILKTEERERLNLPTFGAGLRKFLFEPNTVSTRHQIADRIQRALQLWEPRITVSTVNVEEDAVDPQSAVATIHYQLVATRAAGDVSVRVALAG